MRENADKRYSRRRFHIVLIKPTRYDDDGYPIHWTRSPLPSNSLACMNGIAQDCIRRKVLGEDVDFNIELIDESNRQTNVDRITRRIAKDGGRGLVCLVGVQSNQFPRAFDLAMRFRAADLPVCIGGFHVSGVLAMLGKLTDELQKAVDAGISLFAGEAEECRFDAVLKDADAGRLKPIYDHVKSTPALAGQPLPTLPKPLVESTLLRASSFDLGRGCPFECSFCCIINVQGRKSRFRTPDDLEAIVRENAALGIREFFITDDNLARNKSWEALFDRLIELRAKGFELSLQVQVDTLAYRIDGFIDKAFKAGVEKVFIGLENINPDNLAAVKKRQNKIVEYRDMLLAWKRYPVVITCGYIIGFPSDTRQSILRDLDIIKRELPIDILYLTMLTPLPGSEDHKKAIERGEWIDPDLNKYDLSHRVVRHPTMSIEELDAVFVEAWRRYYTPDHVETVLKRAAALGSNKKLTTASRLFFNGELTRIYGLYSLDAGFGRLRYRKDRRPGLGLESHWRFMRRRLKDFLSGYVRAYVSIRRHHALARRIWADPKRFEYRDAAISVSGETEFETLDLYRSTRGGVAAVEKRRVEQTRRLSVKSKAVAG